MMKRWIERLEGRIREKRPGTGLPDSGCEELIKIVNLCKVYDTGTMKVIGLRNINLTIRRGEFVAIMGQSGSGKSTFMNILGCLDRPAIGHYYLDGIDINAMDDDQLSLIRNKKIGFVFQSFNLISRTTARENVELPMTYAHIPKRERSERAVKLLERVGLGARTEHMPNEMSGGQRQRVAIARALANDPKVLLCDEATSALDNESERHIQKSLEELAKNRTTITIAHRLSTIQNADEIIVINCSGISERGTHQQLLEKNGLYAHYYQMQFEGLLEIEN